MCTVTFVPLGPGSYILTSNRDESPKRITEEPGNEVAINEHESVIFPRDGKAGGTWIAMSKSGRVVCLLNGAFIKHHHQPPYRKSRGLILLECFNYPDITSFADAADLHEIEPFTMVMTEKDTLYELRWDGTQKYFRQLDASAPHIWSSATLYDEATALQKQQKFSDWLKDGQDVNPDKLAWFHGYENKEGFLLDREFVKTVSITTIVHDAAHSEMVYRDLLTNKNSQKLVTIIES